jgi:queuine tRNA-ribosyltransferase
MAHGVDLFDCVIPTTLAWQGTAFTSSGRVRLTRGEHRLSESPLDAACGCPTCGRHSRGYLHHLMKCGEPLGPRLLSVHNLHHYADLMRAARAAIDAGRYAAFARETLAAIDRHEHDPSGRAPGARRAAQVPAAPAGGEDARFEIVVTQSGAPAVRDRRSGEVMHPVIGAHAEAERLYVAGSGVAARLAEPGPPLVVFDVGLGAASNALAALRCARLAARSGAAARPLRLVSFEVDLGALELATSEAGAAALGLDADDLAAARALRDRGAHEEPGATWRLVAGDVLATLPAVEDEAEVVFWDPFSPRHDAPLWTAEAFTRLRRRCGPRAVLVTYSTATSVRSALLLAGFFVGPGDATGPKAETTFAAVRREDLPRAFGARWLERLWRSSAPWPEDAPPDAPERVRAHPQFA